MGFPGEAHFDLTWLLLKKYFCQLLTISILIDPCIKKYG